MDFFDRQQLARRNTRLLVLYFSLSLLCIIFAVYAVAAIVFRRPSRIPFPEAMARLGEWFWDPQLFLWAGGGTLAVVFIASLFKILELRRGGAAVASALGGRPVNPDTQDPAERRLMNVVEEMAIASGLPAPEVYVLDEERGINAFTAGLYPTDAVVAVTRGCLDLLSRDELQGVVAHEFSHILNGDMRLNLRLIGLLSGILAIAMIGYFLLRVSFGGSRRSSSGGRGKGAPQVALFGLALLVIGWIGVFFGRLIKSAISRQREYLADAAAVQFTRNPGGLAGALKKIGGYVLGSRIGSHAAEEASHMFFANGLSKAWFRWTSTHPPLEERIRIWEPTFDGRFPKVVAPRKAPPEGPKTRRGAARRAPLGAAVAGGVLAAEALRHVGAPTPEHVLSAGLMIEELPRELREAVRQPAGAVAVVYALLLVRMTGSKLKDPAHYLAGAPKAALDEVKRLFPSVALVRPLARLPLIELAVPALRNLSPAQFEDFSARIQQLVEADNEIDLFEYALLKMLRRHLEPRFRPLKKRLVQYYAIPPLLPDCAAVLSCLARLGAKSEEEARAAYLQGLGRLGPQASPADYPLLSLEQANLARVDQALDRLAQAALPIRRKILEACAYAAASDGVLQEREAELLRAIAEGLECPIPPFLQFRQADKARD